MGVGVRPATDLLRGLDLDDDGGVPVDAGLKTAVDGLFAPATSPASPCPTAGGRASSTGGWRPSTAASPPARCWGRTRATGRRPTSGRRSTSNCATSATPRASNEVILDGDPNGPFIAFYTKRGRVTAALGVKRDPEMAAIQLLMDQGAMPSADAVRGGFDPLRTLTTMD